MCKNPKHKVNSIIDLQIEEFEQQAVRFRANIFLNQKALEQTINELNALKALRERIEQEVK